MKNKILIILKLWIKKLICCGADDEQERSITENINPVIVNNLINHECQLEPVKQTTFEIENVEESNEIVEIVTKLCKYEMETLKESTNEKVNEYKIDLDSKKEIARIEVSGCKLINSPYTQGCDPIEFESSLDRFRYVDLYKFKLIQPQMTTSSLDEIVNETLERLGGEI